MPELDVSDILSDPDFMDTMTVTRSTQTIDQHGRTQLSTQTFANVACVITAATGDDLKYLPEAAQVSGTITVHTTFRLVEASDTTSADTITFNGRDYTITTLNDWSRYGAGFMQAIATLKNLQEATPA